MDYDFRDGCNLAQVQLFQSIGKVAEQLFNTFACQNDDNDDDGQQGTTTQKTPEMLFRGTEKKTPKVLKRCFGGAPKKK